MRERGLLLLAGWVLIGACGWARGETHQSLNFSFLGGQYFFAGQEGSLAGNASLLYSPAFKLSPTLSLVTLYHGSYRGTKEVTDLVGGGTLFQETMSQRVSARLVWDSGGAWLMKPFMGARYELLKETRDERWFDGLFDYAKAEAGMEFERSLENEKTLRLTYSFFPLWFVNYQSLESQSDLGRELAGSKTLDTYNNYLSLAWELPWFQASVVTWNALSMARFYPQQRVVEPSGSYASTKRRDLTGSTGLSARRPIALGEGRGFVLSAGLDAALSASNQNHLDANQSRFIPRYYNYWEAGSNIAVQWVAAAGPQRARTLGIALWLNRRQYLDRLIQDSGGNYGSELTTLNGLGVSLTGSYPVGERGLALKGAVQAARQTSNMKYEANYRYNFSTLNYLLGFVYTF